MTEPELLEVPFVMESFLSRKISQVIMQTRNEQY